MCSKSKAATRSGTTDATTSDIALHTRLSPTLATVADVSRAAKRDGLHVTAGVIVMLVVLGLALRRRVSAANRTGVELVSWYWHFVDGVWVVVFTVVYLVGR